MNAKEYLNQVCVIDTQLKTIEANIERIKRELQSIDDISLSSTWACGQPHSTLVSDPTGRKASQLADTPSEKKEKLKKQLSDYEFNQIKLRSRLWSKRMEIIDTITKIADTSDSMSRTYYRILILRYVECETWEQIAVDIGYTIRHTWRLHGEALRRIERIIENDTSA